MNKKLMKYIPKEYKKLVNNIYEGKQYFDEDDHKWRKDMIVEWENGTKSYFQKRTIAADILKEFHMTSEFSKEEK